MKEKLHHQAQCLGDIANIVIQVADNQCLGQCSYKESVKLNIHLDSQPFITPHTGNCTDFGVGC